MTSTINEIVLMKTGIEVEKMVERVEGDEPGRVPSVDKMIYTSWQVYPIRTQISSV